MNNDPVWLSQFGSALNSGGRFYSAFSHLMYGRAAKDAAAFEASQYRVNAGQAKAASQFAAEGVDQNIKHITSRALAVAAMSGGASDPSVVNAIARVASEGAYRKAVALYQGDERAREMEMQARGTEYRGEMASAQGKRAAIGATMGGAASTVKNYARTQSLAKNYESTQSLRSKYGGTGPQLGEEERDPIDW